VTEVRPARDVTEVWAALSLRRAVFCDEQGVGIEDELDGRDDAAMHLVAVDGGEVVGTCRLLLDGREVTLGRMAVAPAARGRGLGRALLAEADRRAADLGGDGIVLAAQVGARGLYERAGYQARGDVFLDAGIEHVKMAKALAPG
jgi:predicted GNAT family N-acyltransferase